MPWLLLALVLGGGLLLVSGAAVERAPSGAPWPVGVTPLAAGQAVAWALAHETDAGKLHAFAKEMDPFDAAAGASLHLRAAVLEVASRGGSPLGAYTPNQTGPSTTAIPPTAGSPFSGGMLTRRL